MFEFLVKRWRTMPLIAIYAVWTILFYQLVFTGWTIEYSFYGVLAVIAATLVFLFAYPKRDRKLLIRLTLFILMVSFALTSFVSESMSWRIIDYVVLVILALALGRWIVKLSVLRLLFVVIVISLMQLWVPLSDLGLLSTFSIRYIGHINSPDKQVPSIPVALINDPTRHGSQEIVTLRGHAPLKGEAQQLINMMANDPKQAQNAISAIEELQHEYDLVTVSPGGLGFKEHSATPAELMQLPSYRLGLIDYPFTTPHFINIGSKVRMYVSLSQTPGQLLTTLLQPGSIANALSNLSLSTSHSVSANWANVTGRSSHAVDGLSIQNGVLVGQYHGTAVNVKTSGVAVLGVYPILPLSVTKTPQAVVEGNNVIQVISLTPGNSKVVATLRGTYLYPLTRDIVFADLLGNQQDELLVNTVPAQIFKLSANGGWQDLWVSGQPSFRFETVFHHANGDVIVANAPADITTSPTRYLGGYRFEHGVLVPVFRAYHVDLVDLYTAYVTSAETPELLTSTYAHQKIMLLAPSKIPWLLITEVVYVVLVILGLLRRTQRRLGQ